MNLFKVGAINRQILGGKNRWRFWQTHFGLWGISPRTGRNGQRKAGGCAGRTEIMGQDCRREGESDIKKQDRDPVAKMIIQGRNLANWNQEQTHKQKYNY